MTELSAGAGAPPTSASEMAAALIVFMCCPFLSALLPIDPCDLPLDAFDVPAQQAFKAADQNDIGDLHLVFSLSVGEQVLERTRGRDRFRRAGVDRREVQHFLELAVGGAITQRMVRVALHGFHVSERREGGGGRDLARTVIQAL